MRTVRVPSKRLRVGSRPSSRGGRDFVCSQKRQSLAAGRAEFQFRLLSRRSFASRICGTAFRRPMLLIPASGRRCHSTQKTNSTATISTSTPKIERAGAGAPVDLGYAFFL